MIKVLIVEDMAPIMKRYHTILSRADDIEVVAAVQSGYEAVMMAAVHKPDVVLMDVDMETRTAGLDATSQILRHFPDMKIIILTVCEDDETVFTAFQIGVSDYILKNSTPQEIITCVRDAYFNRSPIRPVIAEKIRHEFQRVKKNEHSFLHSLQLVTQLTQTELDILALLSQGYSRSEICKLRCVEPSTVKTQVRSILKKFDKASVSEVVQELNELRVFEFLRNVKKPQ